MSENRLTHKVAVTAPKQVDSELAGWLHAAYGGARQ